MPGSDVVIRVDGVSKDFLLPHEKITTIKRLFTSFYRRRLSKETQHALRDISFDIKRGEFFGIVGRNGSGKSTLLKILAGIYQPTKGSVAVNGKLVPFIELGVGFNPELTGRENVYLNGAMMGFSESEVAQMYDDIVAFAELEPFMDQKLKNYSSGMQVRLAFSVAIKAEADVLLVDEVLAVGDADFQRKCYDYFKSLKRDKKTVVFVSHEMNAVREFCDRVALIEQSRLQAVGNPSAIADRYERLFMHEPENTDTTGNRWGSGDVEITAAKLSKRLLEASDQGLDIAVSLRVHKPVEWPASLMTGFRVINAAGQCLHETNTWAAGVDMPKLEPGGVCTVTWHCPNVYVDGAYSVDLYAHANGSVGDGWNSALHFRVHKPDVRGFLFVPPVTVTMS